MQILSIILTYLFAAILLAGAAGHFLMPEVYNAFIPNFFPKLTVNYVTGVVEALLGIGLLIPSLREYAALGTLVLMILFLPLHVRDVLIDLPAIGSKAMANFRLPIQFILIFLAFQIWKSSKPVNDQ